MAVESSTDSIMVRPTSGLEYIANKRTDTVHTFSIHSDVHVGDFVQLLLDRRFFNGAGEREHDFMGGYVVGISENFLGISPSNTSNRYHGAPEKTLSSSMRDLNDSPTPTYLLIDKIKKYRVILPE